MDDTRLPLIDSRPHAECVDVRWSRASAACGVGKSRNYRTTVIRTRLSVSNLEKQSGCNWSSGLDLRMRTAVPAPKRARRAGSDRAVDMIRERFG